MGRCIVYHNGAYNLFSSVVDAPLYDSALTLDQLTELIRHEQGENGARDLDARVHRAHMTGCSVPGCTLKELLVANRAGKGETEMPYDEFITRFLTL